MTKQRKTRTIVSVLLAGVMLSGMILSSGAALTDATVKSYEEQLADLQWRQQAAQNELNDIHYAQANAWDELGKLDEIIQYNTQLKNLVQNELDAINLQIETKKQNIADAEAAIERQQTALRSRMVYNYMEDDVSSLELLLGSTSFTDFLTRLEWVQSIFNYDKSVISSLTTEKETLRRKTEELEKAEADQLLRIKDYESVISQNQTLYQQKEDYMAELNANESNALEVYYYNKELENQLNAELEEYLAQLQRQQQSVYVGGSGGWPIAPGVDYYISSEFGWRVLYGVEDFHLGIDIACANGTPICAYNGGTVLTSDYHWSYGNYVLIDHGGGISTLYAHMAERYVSAGDYVTEGQCIGIVGLTGNTFGYHLHFETRENGSVVNPRNYLMFP